MKVLAITVGGSPGPVIKAVSSFEPDYTIFFASTSPNGGSKRQLVEATQDGPPIIEQLGLSSERFEIVELEDPDDLDLCFQKMVSAMEAATARFSPAEQRADYTGGTKSMSAALVLAALHLEWQLQLVTGPRRDLVKVIPDTESLVAVAPASVKLKQLERQAERLFNAFEFAALEKLLEEALQSWHLPHKKKGELQELIVVTRAFRLWDNFQYEESLSLIRTVARRCAKYVELLARIVGRGGIPGYEMAADMVGNALRRAKAGLFDDAVLRLYRAVELLAQIHLLRKHGFDTADLPLEKIPEPLRAELAKCNEGKEKVTAGLLDAYRILAALNDPLGELFQTRWQDRLRELMLHRNKLLVVHGLKALGKAEWDRDREKVLNFIKEATGVLGIELEPVSFPSFREVCDM